MSINPLKREREKLGLTQERLGYFCSMNKQAVMRAEQGLMSQPPKNLCEFLEVDPSEYHEWVRKKRENNIEELRAGNYREAALSQGTLRVTSVAGLAKVLVVQISMVQEYVHNGGGSVRGIISQLIDEWEIEEIEIV